MRQWLRRVTPDLFLAAVIALLGTLALHLLDGIEAGRIVSEVRWEAHEGLTIDERLGVFERSLRRSLLLHLPTLVVSATLLTTLLCRNRRWAWLTSLLATVPALLTGVSYLIDLPVLGSGVVGTYMAISVVVSGAATRLRDQLRPSRAPASGEGGN